PGTPLCWRPAASPSVARRQHSPRTPRSARPIWGCKLSLRPKQPPEKARYAVPHCGSRERAGIERTMIRLRALGRPRHARFEVARKHAGDVIGHILDQTRATELRQCAGEQKLDRDIDLRRALAQWLDGINNDAARIRRAL